MDWRENAQVLIVPFPQMEVQRQQLQAAVDQMEAALKDPVKGPDNVAIYKQYWDQYSGSLEALSKENPMMHHLLQHFRNNWWHLVQPVKEEPAEDRPLSTVPRYFQSNSFEALKRIKMCEGFGLPTQSKSSSIQMTPDHFASNNNRKLCKRELRI